MPGTVARDVRYWHRARLPMCVLLPWLHLRMRECDVMLGAGSALRCGCACFLTRGTGTGFSCRCDARA
eukprot:1477059-Rhodomonas_salina.4